MSFWRNDLRLWIQEHAIGAGVDHADEIFMVPGSDINGLFAGSTLHFDLRINNDAFEKELIAMWAPMFR